MGGSGDEQTRKTGRDKGTGGTRGQRDGGQGNKRDGSGRQEGQKGQGVGDKGTGGQEECGVQPTLAALFQLLG